MQAVQPLDCPQPTKQGERILEVLTCVTEVLGIIKKIEQQTAFQIQQNAEGFRQNAEAIQQLSAKLDTHRVAGGQDSLTEVITGTAGCRRKVLASIAFATMYQYEICLGQCRIRLPSISCVQQFRCLKRRLTG